MNKIVIEIKVKNKMVAKIVEKMLANQLNGLKDNPAVEDIDTFIADCE